LNQYESREVTSLTFRGVTLRGEHGPRPERGYLLTLGHPADPDHRDDAWEVVEDDDDSGPAPVPPGDVPAADLAPDDDDEDLPVAGTAFPIPDGPTDHTLTVWLLRDFWEWLQRVRGQPPWQHLALAFDQLLDAPAYRYRLPDGPTEHATARRNLDRCPDNPCLWIQAGRRVEPALLEDLVGAARMVYEAGLGRQGLHTSEEPKQRLVFDDHTHTVTLDGTPHKVDDPKAYAVYKAICRRGDAPTITKAQIRVQVKGVGGQKTIPNLIDTLPLALHQTVKRNTNGYWHELPKSPKQDHS
jgi:hypothetical protein